MNIESELREVRQRSDLDGIRTRSDERIDTERFVWYGLETQGWSTNLEEGRAAILTLSNVIGRGNGVRRPFTRMTTAAPGFGH